LWHVLISHHYSILFYILSDYCYYYHVLRWVFVIVFETFVPTGEKTQKNRGSQCSIGGLRTKTTSLITSTIVVSLSLGRVDFFFLRVLGFTCLGVLLPVLARRSRRSSSRSVGRPLSSTTSRYQRKERGGDGRRSPREKRR